MKENIYITNDHTGVEMKNALVKHLREQNYHVVDLGNNDGITSNYAELGIELGKKVVENPNSLGITICGTGVGISIAANKVKGVVAGLSYETQTAELIKKHNDANVISLGARLIADDKAIKIVDTFLKTKFEGGRHKERVEVLKNYAK
ncbi:ribose-5-phosphate isomerase B [Williamsoniiplasma luminosum]|uniref:Ribose-5-phosphate isomerase B n=1 Tax=Williamsoniiplasma luminosum TaxID=214888 RepID=A0A2K8NTE6_9MOLU|nr:RpiB/LacA/LacB family sugar-phosphate isomerase [Williamsoniiplasma luminosum]ATZ16836.1 ribose-5-phosphate isomerase B [Williamsoniiplasma luminosum]AVP49508.1 MAG: RpiB/LacA/LacB family sugar-phosphate isomerase [Williamsoniiplasma luminosum]